MTAEERKHIFFLNANDTYFKPNINPVGKSAVTDLHTFNLQKDYQDEFQSVLSKFTNVGLDGKEGYLLIAAPSTWPPFMVKMQALASYLKKWQQKVKIVFVYLAEAHADDVWPLGYEI